MRSPQVLRARVLLAAAGALGAFAVAAPSRAAETKAACADAAEDAQTLRHDAKLRAARDKLLACAREECPDLIKVDCARWLAEVDRALPTLVVRARDARGDDVIGVRVSLDGAPIAAKLDGKAFAVDPGPHHVRYETTAGDVVESDVLVGEGEKERVLVVTFPVRLTSSGAHADGAGARASAPTADAGAAPASARGRSVGPFVVGGVALAALGAFAALDATAWSDTNAMREGCGKTHSCASSDVDALRARIALSEAALGVGLVGLAAGAVWLVLDSRSSRVAVGARPTPGGAALEAAARF